MKTQFWNVDPANNQLDSDLDVQQAATLLKQNEVVAFPTETVYGLGGNALSDEAIAKIYQAKGRPGDNPLIVHIASKEQLNDLVTYIPRYAQALIDAFWPGPLTLVLPAKKMISQKVTAGLTTVAVRMPNHPIALALIKASKLPIAAPSANLSGRPSPTTANHVSEDLFGRIAGILDGGPTGVGVESTVVDCSDEVPTLLRPGGITKEQIEKVVPVVQVDPSIKNDQLKPKSPGMKYKHYAPRAPLFLVDGSSARIQALVDEKTQENLSVGVLTTEENKSAYRADVVMATGHRSDLSSVASGLYHALRTFDSYQVDIIFSEVFPYNGIGTALMNRLLKAADRKVLR